MSDPAKPQGPDSGASSVGPGQGASQGASRSASAAAFASASTSTGAAPDAQAAAATSDPAAQTTALEARIAELESQQADLTDRLLRAHAEMDNLRKRTERDKADATKYAITNFAHDIVGISDNFQRAASAVPADAAQAEGPVKSLVEGVLMTERAFLQVLEKNGVRRIDPNGEPFDPNRHQAVMEEQNTEVAAGTVIKVFQPGYMIEDRVLRPAMVVVARGGFKPVRTPAAEASATAPATAPANENAPGRDNGGTASGS